MRGWQFFGWELAIERGKVEKVGFGQREKEGGKFLLGSVTVGSERKKSLVKRKGMPRVREENKEGFYSIFFVVRERKS